MGSNKRQEQRCTEPMLCRGRWGGGGAGQDGTGRDGAGQDGTGLDGAGQGANIKRSKRDPVAVLGHLADLVTSARGGGGEKGGRRGGEGERRGRRSSVVALCGIGTLGGSWRRWGQLNHLWQWSARLQGCEEKDGGVELLEGPGLKPPAGQHQMVI